MGEASRRWAGRRAVVAGLAAWIAAGPGCGGGDSGGRLAQGSTARADRGDGAQVHVYFSQKTEQVPAGTRVQVLSDSEGEVSDARRKVVVGIQDGAFRGMAGQMERADLRAVD